MVRGKGWSRLTCGSQMTATGEREGGRLMRGPRWSVAAKGKEEGARGLGLGPVAELRAGRGGEGAERVGLRPKEGWVRIFFIFFSKAFSK